MDAAYHDIQAENFPKKEETAAKTEEPQEQPSLNAEFQEAWGAVANSPWAARLGGLWGTVKKTGEQYYTEAQKTAGVAGEQATKGINDLITRTRAFSLNKAESQEEGEENTYKINVGSEGKAAEEHPDRPDSLPADIVKEAQSLMSRFRSEAAKQLKNIEKAEDAADEALIRLGSNLTSYLKEVVSIAAPTEIIEKDGNGSNKVLFESKDSDGKRVIHTNRLDAQLHVIHCSADGFMTDPAGPEFEAWCKEFDIDAKTEQIATDLDKYEELRRAMEKVVPEKVEYAVFWKRYYFLKRVAELEEQRRKDLLKGAATNVQEEVNWDDDEEETITPNAEESAPKAKAPAKPAPTGPTPNQNLDVPKPHDVLSLPDSEASYAIISAATSKAGGSPKETKKPEESDEEEDWE